MSVFDQVANGLGTLNRAINSPAPLNGFSINEFKSNALKNGVLRNSLYLVELLSPGYPQSLMYFTDSVTIPSVDFATQVVKRYGYGPVEYVPYLPVFQNLQMSFIVEAGQENALNVGLRRMSAIVGFQNYSTMNSLSTTALDIGNPETVTQSTAISSSPYEVAYKRDYEFTIKVYVYNEQQDAILIYTFNQCYARYVGGIRLAWGDNDTYLRADITFQYTDYYIESSTNPISDALGSLAGLTTALGLGSQSSTFNALKYPVGIVSALNVFNASSITSETPNLGGARNPPSTSNRTTPP